jgi:protein SCO1/2
MKTKMNWLLVVLALASFGRATEVQPAGSQLAGAEKARASSRPTAGEPACCVDEKVAATSAPLTARSLYQLDAMWTSDAGKPVQLAALRGRPVVLTMFFASCGYACPMLVHDMQRLRETLPADVREKVQLVLVSFDTTRDTPAALKTYRESHGLEAGWTLLRGDAASVQELAMLLGVKFKQDAQGNFSHSNVITILNAEGEIAHQRTGLMGDVSEAAKAVARASK